MLMLFASAGTYRREAVLKVAFVALGFLDLLLTLYAFSQGFVELNPFIRALLERPWGLAMVKGVLPLAIAWLVPGRLLVPSILALVAVNGWNLAQLVGGGGV
ncbi:hypothetical protein HRbin23_00059 [bacterium HR23]|nr:hypothetical protein HRbin23_00059 [bacterium HR23]